MAATATVTTNTELVQAVREALGLAEGTLRFETVRGAATWVYVMMVDDAGNEENLGSVWRSTRKAGRVWVSDALRSAHATREEAVDAELRNWLNDFYADALVVKRLPSTYRIVAVSATAWELRLGARGGLVLGAVSQAKDGTYRAMAADVWGVCHPVAGTFQTHREATAAAYEKFRTTHANRQAVAY